MYIQVVSWGCRFLTNLWCSGLIWKIFIALFCRAFSPLAFLLFLLDLSFFGLEYPRITALWLNMLCTLSCDCCWVLFLRNALVKACALEFVWGWKWAKDTKDINTDYVIRFLFWFHNMSSLYIFLVKIIIMSENNNTAVHWLIIFVAIIPTICVMWSDKYMAWGRMFYSLTWL